jgi:hypothetical protein
MKETPADPISAGVSRSETAAGAMLTAARKWSHPSSGLLHLPRTDSCIRPR